MELERERAYNKQQFQKNFRDMQLISQALVREHESSRLSPKLLEKNSKAINKCAKNLRSMMALGNLAQPTQINKEIESPGQFDESIHELSKLIWDFAHNPVHQNGKVFNTTQAATAQTHLVAIIRLSKALGDKAKLYSNLSVTNDLPQIR